MSIGACNIRLGDNVLHAITDYKTKRDKMADLPKDKQVPETDICWGPNCEHEIIITRCCSGQECGCRGMPGDPPFCSQECWDAWSEEQRKNNLKPKDNEIKG